MTIQQIINIIILTLSLLAIILTFGVVWRVERKLDLSYKFILLAIMVFSCGVIFDLFKSFNIHVFEDINYFIKGLFIIFYLLGILKMRSLIREINKTVLKKEKIDN